jgi:3-phosphoshikimate 1-carboxyvinyltransferase
VKPAHDDGAVRVPGDKSVTHRALILGALANGRSRVRGALVSLDTRSTAECLRSLGIDVPDLDRREFAVPGGGLRGLREPRVRLDCGNSGTTARLLLGVLAGCPFASVVTGDASLRSRPMRRVTAPLAAAGAKFAEMGDPDRLPVGVYGGMLRTIEHDSPRASAQVKSALLLAAVTGGTSARVTEPTRSRDHTERMLAAMGAWVRIDGDSPVVVRIDRVDRLEPLDITVPGDFSSAAFLIARAILGGPTVRIADVGINPTRTGMLDVVRRMGARIDIDDARMEGGEPVADVSAGPTRLLATHIGPADVARALDEVPVLAMMAARAEGETRISGAAELRVKESDRLAALASNLRAIGAHAEETRDGLVIEGTDAPLRGRVETRGDHRIAMAFGVLAGLPGNEIEIEDPALADVSFPGFWAMVGRGAADGP